MKEMNCQETENNMMSYFDKELSNETALSFVSHIAECQHCAHAYLNLKAVLQTIDTEKIQQDDFYFYTRLQQRMDNKKHTVSVSQYIPKYVLQSIAIVCLLAIGIFTGIQIGNQYSTNNINLTAEETRTSQLNAYSEEMFIAEMNNEKMESLFTSNQ